MKKFLVVTALILGVANSQSVVKVELKINFP